MRFFSKRWSPGSTLPLTLIASALIAFTALVGTGLMTPFSDTPTSMFLSYGSVAHTVGDEFTIELMISSNTAVNVFSGEVRFNPSLLHIERIAYNTSIADLWAEKPWYTNGEGTLNFGGGTTRQGGFTGEGLLLSITFKAVEPGTSHISIHDPRILLHDGLGTDATVHAPLDAIITIRESKNLIEQSQGSMATPVVIVTDVVSPDLNGDGVYSIADVGIFVEYFARGDIRGDIDGDGHVTSSDLSRVLSVQ